MPKDIQKELDEILWSVTGPGKPGNTPAKRVKQANAKLEALIAKEVKAAVEAATAKKHHLLRNQHVAFCGWGSQSGQSFVEIVEDATCKTCIRLALQEGDKDVV